MVDGYVTVAGCVAAGQLWFRPIRASRKLTMSENALHASKHQMNWLPTMCIGLGVARITAVSGRMQRWLRVAALMMLSALAIGAAMRWVDGPLSAGVAAVRPPCGNCCLIALASTARGFPRHAIAATLA